MTDTNNSMIDALCLQRRQRQLYNIPPIRLETKTPYGGAYSKFDLDMRRKAEVLKYAGNASNTKTNNLTKSELYAMMARGGARLNPTTINAELVAGCPPNASILTPTTYSDVPGPVILLYDDESVPLYNYSTNVDSYAQLPPAVYTTFDIVTTPNVALANDVSGQLFAQIFTTLGDYGYATYTVNIPIGINVSGTITEFSGTKTGTFSVDYVKLAQYFNGSVVNVYKYETPALYCTLDFSGNMTQSFAFSATNVYVGNAIFDNLSVYGAPGYVYQWHVSAHISYSPTTTTPTSSATLGASSTKTIAFGISSGATAVYNGCALYAKSAGANGGVTMVAK